MMTQHTSTHEAPGYLLTFEGGEGGGKGTQIEGLVAHLQSLAYAVTQTREPGGTRIGDAVRRILLDLNHRGMDFRAEVLLYEASRAQLLREVIHPALAQGHMVVCDRFYDSTTVYQGYARGIDLIPTAVVLYCHRSRRVGVLAAIWVPLLLSTLHRTVSEHVVLWALPDAKVYDCLLIHGVMRLRARGTS